MSEVDDLTVDVMLRSETDAELAVIQLIRMAEADSLSAKDKTLVMKAVERRMEKVKAGTDLYDFLKRLARFVDSDAQAESKPPSDEDEDNTDNR